MVQATEADEARLARHAPVALLCVTPQGGVLANNSAWLDLIGADAAPHDSVLGHLSRSDAEALSHALELVGERGGRVHVRTEFGQPGRVVSWELVGEAMQGVIHATVLDRTAEERQLQGFAHTVRAIYEVSPVMLHTADADGCIEMVSDAWLRALGYAREQVVGRQFSEFLAASSRRLAESLRAEEAAGPFEDIPLRLRRSDGSELDVLLTETTERSSGGHLRRTLAVCRDVTERNQLSEELRQRVEALRRREVDLAEANRLLTQSNEDLERFAYVASHDLQEPLRKIVSYCQLIDARHSENLEPQGRRWLLAAVTAAARMRTMIDDLLLFARVEAPRDLERVNLADAMATTIDILEPTLVAAEAALTVGPLPVVRGRMSLLVLVLQNLIGNALKYRSPAAPVISVEAERDGGFWRISVADNGIGIEPRFQERIFEVFQRLHGRDAYPGNGIGLSVCRKVVRSLGGTIGVEPNPAGGSRFWFTLPAEEESR